MNGVETAIRKQLDDRTLKDWIDGTHEDAAHVDAQD